jgi:SAM-dependent methyltransferase
VRRRLRRLLRDPRFAFAIRAALWLRGLCYRGDRYFCPVCRTGLRTFVTKRSVFRTNPDGYCPRCDAKARHRRLWLWLEERTNLLKDELRLLEVAPWWSLSRRLASLPNLRFEAVDRERAGPHVTLVGDLVSLPLAEGSFDAALCIHVLEHVEDDRGALRELHRILRPGGWAIVSVPIRLDRATHEDPTITDPAERQKVFGERSHVRWYGADLADRLREAGFEVALDLASSIPDEVVARHGLRRDENLFTCRKPA